MKDLPHGWADTSLGEITLLRGEKLDPATAPDAPFIGLEDIEPHTSRILKTGQGSDVKSSVARFSAGNVLYSRLRPYLNKVTVPDFDGIASAEILVLQPTAATEAEFVRRRIMTREFLDFAALLDKGDRPRVNFKEIAEFPVALPPLAEQQRIVAKVDGLTARTARARKELDRIPTLIARYKQRLLAKALAGDLTRDWRRNQSIDDIGQRTIVIETPARFEMAGSSSWEFATIGDICKIEGGSQPPKSTFVYEPQPGYVRLIQIRDYKSDKNIVFIPKNLARRFVSKNDIMIGRYGPPIFQILRGLEGAYNVALMKAVPVPEKILSDFLYWFLKSPTLLAYVELDSKRSSGQDGVNKDHLLKFPVPLPPLEEQAEIVRRIESAFGWLDRVAADHAAAARLLPKLDAAILAKAFQGKLVPQDPNDEPAAKLLERIKAEREALPKEKRGRKTSNTVSSKDLQTMAKNLEQVLAEAGDWISAQDAFQQCGIGGAATTEEIEKIYAELRKLDKAGRLEAEPVNDDQGRKLHDRLRLKAA
jgi:type I restriction enzyme S subunit